MSVILATETRRVCVWYRGGVVYRGVWYIGGVWYRGGMCHPHTPLTRHPHPLDQASTHPLTRHPHTSLDTPSYDITRQSVQILLECILVHFHAVAEIVVSAPYVLTCPPVKILNLLPHIICFHVCLCSGKVSVYMLFQLSSNVYYLTLLAPNNIIVFW